MDKANEKLMANGWQMVRLPVTPVMALYNRLIITFIL